MVVVVSSVAGFAEDLWRHPAHHGVLVLVWNWTIRGLSSAAFAALLAGLFDRIASEAALARTDALTGAINRLAFHETISREMDLARRAGRAVTLAFVDLDGFKSVNDASGHDEGDRVLRAVVETARATLRDDDLVFRIGGDEFALLLGARWILLSACRECSKVSFK
ncbi:MAG: GGDEF domain-containing protein [Deltaproteobacteria bacterium]